MVNGNVMMVHVLTETTSVMVLLILVMMLVMVLIVQMVLMKLLKYVVILTIYITLTFMMITSVLEWSKMNVLQTNGCVMMVPVYLIFTIVMVPLLMEMPIIQLIVQMVLMKY